MAAMNAWFALSLAFLLPVVGASEVVEDAVTVHRCTDSKGHDTWQNKPCPKGTVDSSRLMVRPLDPPAKPAAKPAPAPALAIVEPEPESYPPPPELIPPPPMYRCTSYDGIERFSESYDPNPRCEPLVLYYPYPNQLTPAQALSCRWVQDSCVRLSDEAACARWKTMKKEAASALLASFSDTKAYRTSELARLTQIVEESCPP
jgi:hypothetical protein